MAKWPNYLFIAVVFGWKSSVLSQLSILQQMSANPDFHSLPWACYQIQINRSTNNIFTNNRSALHVLCQRAITWMPFSIGNTRKQIHIDIFIHRYLRRPPAQMRSWNIYIFELTFEGNWAKYPLFKAIQRRFEGSFRLWMLVEGIALVFRALQRKAEIFWEVAAAPVFPDLICHPIPFFTLPLFP